jgi:phosphatidylserine decarboxylase
MVSPADSKILNIAEVKSDENLLIKGINYKLGEFLTGIRNYKIEKEIYESLK